MAGSLACFTPWWEAPPWRGRNGSRSGAGCQAIIGGVAGFVAFHGLNDFGGGMRGVPYLWPSSQEQRLGAMVAAVLAGLVGWLAGQMMRHWRQWLRQPNCSSGSGGPRSPPAWWWDSASGASLGSLLRRNQLKPLVLGDWSLSTAILMLSAIAKLLMVGLCLETGWRRAVFP